MKFNAVRFYLSAEFQQQNTRSIVQRQAIPSPSRLYAPRNAVLLALGQESFGVLAGVILLADYLPRAAG